MDNMQKGRISENTGEKMFKEAGFKVVRAGYENTFKGLADKENLLQGPAAKYIRHHPEAQDNVVQLLHWQAPQSWGQELQVSLQLQE